MEIKSNQIYTVCGILLINSFEDDKEHVLEDNDRVQIVNIDVTGYNTRFTVKVIESKLSGLLPGHMGFFDVQNEFYRVTRDLSHCLRDRG